MRQAKLEKHNTVIVFCIYSIISKNQAAKQKKTAAAAVTVQIQNSEQKNTQKSNQQHNAIDHSGNNSVGQKYCFSFLWHLNTTNRPNKKSIQNVIAICIMTGSYSLFGCCGTRTNESALRKLN